MGEPTTDGRVPRPRTSDSVPSNASVDVEATQERLRGVCHDLRQPIAAILALTAATIDSGCDAASRRRAGQIATEARYLSALVQGVLDEEQSKDFNPFAVISDAAAAARRSHPGEVEFLVVVDDLVLHGDPTGIRRLLDNLLSNACRAAGGGGHVRVTAAPAADRLLVSIEDDGPGFSGEISHGHLRGLGIVERYVALYGGRCSYGESVLGGALVQIDLPAARSSPTSRGGRAHRAV